MTEIPREPGFWSDVLRRIMRRERGRADAEDLLHAAYLKLQRYAAVKPVDNPAGFLVHAAANIAVDISRHERSLTINPLDVSTLNIADAAPLQDEVLAARARLERVRTGLAQLPARTQDVFLMYRIEGLKYREIAERLAISQSAVEKHIAKAVHFLTEWTQGW
jgi:RNA polymerase sigma-70 factor (ECF subfamily)